MCLTAHNLKVFGIVRFSVSSGPFATILVSIETSRHAAEGRAKIISIESQEGIERAIDFRTLAVFNLLIVKRLFNTTS